MTARKKRGIVLALLLLAAAIVAVVLVVSSRSGKSSARLDQPLPAQPEGQLHGDLTGSTGETPLAVAPTTVAVAPAPVPGGPGPAPVTPPAAVPVAHEPGPATQNPGRTVDVQGALLITDPMNVKLSREDAQLLRHYELEKTEMRVKLCIDALGTPSSTKILHGSGAADVDAHVNKQLQEWRYLPTRVNGVAIASCTDVTVAYRIQD